ncbi:MAG: hypothetical protein KGM99_12320 [Burkholderiales bacterium]|nr:hypothetical protein [Burkholderiales bacterium]
MKTVLAICLIAITFSGAAQRAFAQTEPVIQSYSLDVEAKLLSDRKNRGISDTFNGPGAEINITAVHESGFVGYLQLGTVSKTLFVGGNGAQVTAALGYRGGQSDAFHYGVGFAQEWFPGAKVENAPTNIDWATGEPTGLVDTKFDSSFALIEFGYGILEGRYLYVLSKDFRGNNTATLCGGTYLPAVLAGGDPANAISCYGDQYKNSGGSHLLDLDMKYALNGQTKLLAHLGYQKIKNFSGLDAWDYRLGLLHTRWGLDFSAEVVGAHLNNRDFAVVTDSSGQSKKMDRTTLVLAVAKRF